ncbi:MAG: transglutaminase family protein [Gammaproteobacteria bacterium]|nr:transglutaminase family protein [Gammaproteobacteria bacterium]
MNISIDHETRYSYEEPVCYSIQSLRLTPQPCDNQLIKHWAVEASDGDLLQSFADSFGNLTHTLVIDHPHQEVLIRVRGTVITSDNNGVLSGSSEPFPPLFYLRETAQTKADGAIRALARSVQGDSPDRLDVLHRLMAAVREAIDYRTGESHAATTASEALANGLGVCQDHAHVFISAARSLGIPARYVSGYLLHSDEGETSEAAHAWAEALTPDLGWIGFDVANCLCATDQYVRIGVGLDYHEAAPIRGVRRGGGAEQMEVQVQVFQAQGAAQ